MNTDEVLKDVLGVVVIVFGLWVAYTHQDALASPNFLHAILSTFGLGVGMIAGGGAWRTVFR